MVSLALQLSQLPSLHLYIHASRLTRSVLWAELATRLTPRAVAAVFVVTGTPLQSSPLLQLPPPPSLLSLPLSHDALQELREIHSQQQRHKQKEMEGEAHALMSVSAERKSAELQESR